MKAIKQLLLMVVILLCSSTVNAYDFEVDGIYYNLISNSDLTVGVVKNPSVLYEGDIVIPSTIIYNSKKLTVARIETNAFKDCTGLSSVTIDATSIGYHAFEKCINLTSVTMGNNVNTIGDGAFFRCSGLTSITIPNSVTDIGDDAFYECSSLASATIENGIIGHSAFYNCSSLTSVTIGNGVGRIGDYAFSRCSSLTSITIPNSVRSIGDDAFWTCGLKNLRIEDGVHTLSCGDTYVHNGDNKGLFYNSSLETVYLGRNIVNDGSNVVGIFYKSLKLKQLTIGDSVTNIGNDEFRDCSNLANVTIGKNVKTIEESAFSGCSRLTSVEIPNSVTIIGKFAFNACRNLVNVTISSNVRFIDNYTFANCSSLTSITIPNSVWDIGSYAFNGCSKVENIYLMRTTPPRVGSYNFTEEHFIHTALHVPHGSLATYQDDMMWKNFWNIKEFYIDKYFYINYIVDNVLFETDSIKHGAELKLLDEPVKEGYTFSGWSEVPETMPAKDVTVTGSFAVNKYLVTFKIDGEVIASDSLEYGAAIIAPEVPEREGYTFDGWGEIAETVPANDMTIEGSYSVNFYLLSYTVDGETVQTDSVAYGTAVTLLDDPTKEGHTFSGWSEAPETMPASDVIISGTFTVNKYLVTFKIGDEVIAADSLEYGATIVAPEAPEREGYTFDGWEEVAETVPASDVTYEGSYSVNTYKVYYYVGEELVHTEEVVYGEAIPEYIYEPKEDCTFLGWIGDTYETMPAHDVTYTANIESGIEELTKYNGQLTIYDFTGRKVTDTEKLKSGIYIINRRKLVIH